MADEPEDKPSPAGAPTPFTTAGQFAGLARETLWSNTNATLNLAGLAREALISGIGLDGTVSAKSSASSGNLSLVSGGVSLAGTARGSSSVAAFPSNLVSLAGRAKATSAVRPSVPTLRASLAGRITTEASASVNVPGRTPVSTRIGSQSSARSSSLSLAAPLHGRIESTSALSVLPLPTPVNMAIRIKAASHASLYMTIPLTLPGGRITSRSRGQIYFAPRPPAALGEVIVLNVG